MLLIAAGMQQDPTMTHKATHELVNLVKEDE